MTPAFRLLLAGVAALCLALGAGVFGHLLGRELSFELAGRPLRLLAPENLALMAALPLLFAGIARSLSDLPVFQRLLSAVLRAMLVCALSLALARLSDLAELTQVSAVFAVDVSDSVTDADLQRATEIVEAARAAQGSHDLQLLTFASQARRVPLPEPGSPVVLKRHEQEGGQGESGGAQTDIQRALQLSYGLFPANHLRRVVVLSDGLQTRGSLLAEAQRAADFGVRVSHQMLHAGRPPEVAVRGLSAPGEVKAGERFELTATLFASQPGKVRLKLYQGDVLNGLDAVRELELPKGETDVRFKSIARIAGETPYRLELQALSPDRFKANNRAELSVPVRGRPSVLLVEQEAAHGRYLARALASTDFDVDLRTAAALPRTLAELERFDFFILSDVPAQQVSLQQMDLIERYVRDLGGGFMMAGGENSFGLGGYHGTRMERILPVRMESERRRDEHSLALSLVLDQSGSMSGQKIELAKEAAKATAELLSPEDSIAVVGFSSEPERTVRMQSARNRARIAQSIGRLTAQGGTAIFPALDLAFQDLVVVRARVKHVILLTDGQTQEAGIPELVQAMRAEGITVSTVGLGNDVNRSLLQTSASVGGGRAYFTDDPHNIPRIFMRETTTVGRSGAVEEFFQPLPAQRADFLKGFDLGRVPFLRGYVATQAKPAPAQVILQSDLGEPILARWRVGLGYALAWTSDLKHRWAVEWVRWDRFGSFFGQLLREHMRRRATRQFPMEARMERGQAVVTVDALGPDDRFINDLEATLTVARGGSPAALPPHVPPRPPLRQIAPGRYQARFPLHAYGAFALQAVFEREGQRIAEAHAPLSNPYPQEYASLTSDPEVLARLSGATGGHRDPEPARLFQAGDERVLRPRDLWPHLCGFALALFLLDLLLRRIRLGGLKP